MPKNDDGEFELVLGNRQLLSVFFIVAILFGVFFTMGYIVGRNSAPGFAADSRKADRSPIVTDAQRPAPAVSSAQPEAAAVATPPPPQPAAAEPGAANTATDQPAAQSPASSPGGSETAAASSRESRVASVPEEPSPGTYLQVIAVQRAEAELFVDVLAKKGFHALYTPVKENPNLFRVLVGPFKDIAAIAQARTDLEKAGFKGYNAFVRKY